MNFCRILLLLLLVGVAAGCTAGPKPNTDMYAKMQQQQESSSGFPYIDQSFTLAPNDVVGITYLTSAKPTREYYLQVGDVLLAEFHQQEYLNRNIVIRPDGRATFPFIGDVKAATIPVSELRSSVMTLYKKQNIFDNVSITISVLSFNSRLRELQAAINNSLYGQTRETVISNDGHLDLPFAGRLYVAGKSLQQVKTEVDGAYEAILPGVDVTMELKQMRSNYIYVLGEVNNPGMVGISGPMGVTQAVAAAGGYRITADLSSVVVLRSGESKGPMGRIVDVENILATGNLSQDVLIRRFDVLYVPPSAIKKLNDGILLYIRNMMPINTQANIGFSYMWGDTTSSTFNPF